MNPNKPKFLVVLVMTVHFHHKYKDNMFYIDILLSSPFYKYTFEF